MPTSVALVDCNNFYASCECLFQPALRGKPVVVLSNNDGCVIARSEEAKSLGIPMGLPAFQLAERVQTQPVRSLFVKLHALWRYVRTRHGYTGSVGSCSGGLLD
jgi:DNA polymerase V